MRSVTWHIFPIKHLWMNSSQSPWCRLEYNWNTPKVKLDWKATNETWQIIELLYNCTTVVSVCHLRTVIAQSTDIFFYKCSLGFTKELGINEKKHRIAENLTHLRFFEKLSIVSYLQYKNKHYFLITVPIPCNTVSSTFNLNFSVRF